MSHPNNERLEDDRVERKISKMSPKEFLNFLGLDKEYVHAADSN